MWLRLGLLALLPAAFALRLAELARQDIWWDEARNLDVALRPITQIAGAPELDIQPPLYYWLLHGWLRLMGLGQGASPEQLAWAARFLSVWAGVVGVVLVAVLARRIGGAGAGPRAAFAAALVASCAPFWLAESQEARMYTAALALLTAAACCLLAAEHGVPAGRRVRLAAFALLSAASFLTHYNTAFVLVAWYGWWLIVSLAQADRVRRLRDLALTGLGSLLLVLPVAPIALRQMPAYENPNLTVPDLVDYLRRNWQGHVGGYAFDPAAGAWAGWWLWGVGGVAALGLIALVVARRRHSGSVRGDGFWQGLAFLGVWLIGGLLLYYIAVLDRGAFNVRYAAFVTPALYALVGLGIAGWGHRLAWPVLALVAAGLLLFARADLLDPRFAREDSAGVAQWLRGNTRPGDVVLVDQKYPLGFYYGRYGIPPQEPASGPEAAPARYLFVDINTIDAQLNAWASAAERIFWVQWFESDTDPRHVVPFLLDQEGRHAGEQWFQGWSVDWWEMEPPARFELAPALRPIDVRVAQAVHAIELSLPERVTPGAPLPVAVRWQRAADPVVTVPLKARVALYDAEGNRLAQADERLLNDRHLAPSEWQASDRPLNVYLLQPETPLAAGTYAIRVLVYDADTLAPLEMLDAAGAAAGVEASLGQVRIEPVE